MIRETDRERGAAMVLALGVIVVLSLLAMIVMSLLVTEKVTEQNDYSGSRSFYSADAASEAGVHWIRQQTVPPAILDSLRNVHVSNTYTTLGDDHLYKFDVQYVGKRIRPGWSVEYKDYAYRVEASGTSARSSQSAVELGATRLYREGY